VSNQRRRNPRGEGSRLRGEIVAAATALLEDNGSEDAITLRGVARQAGIAAPSIYAHFADREAILAAVVAQAFVELGEVLAAAADHGDPRRSLRLLCEAYLDFAEARPRRYRVIFGRHRVDKVEVKPLEELWGAQAFARLTASVAACTPAGRSPQVAATALWAGLHGYASLGTSVPAFPWPDRQEILDALLAPIIA
jgi:AcrR family transcriptional regulator